MRVCMRYCVLLWFLLMAASPGFVYSSVSFPTYGVRQIVYPIGETSPTPFGDNLTGGSLSNPGFYALSNDINGGISIDSDNVYLNLNGYRIHVTGQGSPVVGVNLATGKHDITVKNGTIGPDNQVPDTLGIQLNNNSNVTIESCKLVNNAQGMVLNNANKVFVRDCEALNSTVNGVALQGCSGVRVANTIAAGTRGSGAVNGFLAAGGQNNIIDGCTAQDTVTDGTSTGSYAAGFQFVGTENKSILQNCLTQGSYAATGGNAYGVLFPKFLSLAGIVNPRAGQGDWVENNQLVWCCDGSNQYLAVAGATVNGMTQGYSVVVSDAAGTNVYSINSPTGSWDNVDWLFWCCAGDKQYLAVAGPINNYSGYSVVVSDPTGKTVNPINSPIGSWGNHVNQLSWCCAGDKQYLAVAGNIDSYPGYSMVVSDPTGKTVNSINPSKTSIWEHVDQLSWCCDEGNQYLAVAGATFNGTTKGFSVVVSDPTGTKVYSINPPADQGNWDFNQSPAQLSWCCTGDKQYLAVAGNIDSYPGYSVVVSNLTGTSVYSINPSQTVSWINHVDQLVWCCDGSNQYLAVAGNTNSYSGYSVVVSNPTGTNVYFINPSQTVSWINHVDQLVWCCDGSNQYLAVAGAINNYPGYSVVTSDPTGANVYSINSPIGSWNYVDWLSWCCDGSNQYLAVAGNIDSSPGYSVVVSDPTGTNVYSINPSQTVSWVNHVDQLSWCCAGDNTPYLAVAGNIDSYPGYSVVVFDPMGQSPVTINPPAGQGSWLSPFYYEYSLFPPLSWCCNGTTQYLAVAGPTTGGTGFSAAVYSMAASNNLIIRSNTATDSAYNATGSAYGFFGNDITSLVVSNMAYQNSTNYNDQIQHVTNDYTTNQIFYNFSAD